MENGTDVENEVKRVLGINGSFGSLLKQVLKRTDKSVPPGRERSLLCDEVAARLFVPWFLKRLDIGDALKVAFGNMDDNTSSAQSPSVRRTGVLVAVAVVLYALSCCIKVPDGPICPWLYIPMVTLLSLALWSMVVGAQRVFAVALPRALLTCLAAWLALADDLKGAFVDIEDLFFNSTNALFGHHAIMTADGLAFVTALLVCLLAWVFTRYDIRHYAEGSKAWSRAFWVCVVIFAEAFICGMAASPIALYNLRRAILPLTQGDYCTPSLFFINIFGSAMALFAGVVVKYLWEGQSVAESLGEPI
jgi:hypothetical protein